MKSEITIMQRLRKWFSIPIVRRTVVIALIVFIIFAVLFIAAQIYIIRFAKSFNYTVPGDVPQCDAVMVLGARVYKSGKPSALLRDRLDYGYELYAQGRAGKILASGDHGREDYDEVNSMKDYLMEKGVPSADIFMDHAGFNTYDSMYRARDVFCVNSLIISTQNFHMSRAVYLARALGLEAYGYPCEDKSAYAIRTMKLRESVARVKALLDAAVKRKPRYLGDKIPITGDGDATSG